MKKILAILALALALSASNAEAATISRMGTITALSGTVFDYQYTLSTDNGSETALEVAGNALLGMYINLPGAQSDTIIREFYNAPVFGSGLYTLNYQISTVPLPAALPMFGMALAGFGFYRRRKTAA